MNRKWKKAAALGLAVLIGGMMPMSTMLAAEDNTEAAQEIEADSGSDAEVISDENGSVDEEESTVEENAGGEVNTDDENAADEDNADDENADDEVNADDGIADDEVDPVDEQNVGIKVMSASDAAEAGDAEGRENAEENPTENTVISESDVYRLKTGVKYHLAAGNWQVDGDTSVYQGDIDFYVKGNGDYKFSK